MFGFLKRLLGAPAGSHPPLQPESQFIVRLSDSEVVCEHPDGQTERVAWEELQEFLIVTTDEGPCIPDVFWVLEGSPTSRCVIPQGATGDKALLARLQELPGFDNTAFLHAMSSTENDTFLCWKRP